MVRQLASTEHGVPIELYFFVNDIRGNILRVLSPMF